jgi:hypothetical protein
MRWVWLLSLLFIFSFQLKAEDRSYYRILEQLYNASNEQEWNRAMVQFQGWIHNEYQRSKMSMSEEEFTKRNMDKMTQEIDKRDKKAEEAEKNKTAAPPLQPKQQQQAAATKPTTLVKQSPQGTPTTPAPTDWIPAWFKQIDYDKDGQIGLHEWIRAKGKISDFDILDRNKDGLFTREELKRALKLGLVK